MEEQIQNNHTASNSNSMLSQTSINNLLAAAPWMKFISILGFITSGFLVIGVIIMMIAFGSSEKIPGIGFGMGIGMVFMYVLLAIIVIIPNLYLYKYAINLKTFHNLNDNESLEKAFLMQNKYWTIMGVLAIIYLTLVGVGMIAFGLGAFLM